MTHYSVHPRDRIFVKGYKLWFYPRNIGKNIGKNISKTISSKHSQNVLIILNKRQQMQLKLLQKELFQKQQKNFVIWLIIKLLINLRQNKQLKVKQKIQGLIQKSDSKLLMI